MSPSSHPPLHVLFVLPYVPSPVRVRPFQFIRHLAAQGHKITVVALDDGHKTEAAIAELTRICAEVHVVPLPRRDSLLNALASIPTRTPLWAAWCRSPDMGRVLEGLANPADFDVVHVEHLRAAHFAKSMRGIPGIIDAVDCITDLRRQMATQPDGPPLNRLMSWFEWRKLRTYETRMYRNYRRIAITSDHDSAALAALDSGLPPIDVIPNGVDLDYFTPDDAASEDNCLVFSGKMSYFANDDAAKHLVSAILPRIRSVRANTRLAIVGSGPSKSLLKVAARAGNVHVTGFVDDIRPHLRRAAVAVCPMRIGVGIQNKVLEAMSVARPVVCSSIAARSLNWEASDPSGIAGAADRPVLVADDPARFAEFCVHLLDNPSEAVRRGQSARRYVENYHDWNTAAARLAGLYRTVTSNV